MKDPWQIFRSPGTPETEAQPLISYFELLAQLALLVCRLRSPSPTSRRIAFRQRSDNVTAGAAIMKGFTTAHLLRRFFQVIIRWTQFPVSSSKTSRGKTTSGPMRSVATKRLNISHPSELQTLCRSTRCLNEVFKDEQAVLCFDQGLSRTLTGEFEVFSPA